VTVVSAFLCELCGASHPVRSLAQSCRCGDRPLRIYVAGPMTIIGPPDYNYPAFRAAAAELAAQGYLVEDPSAKGFVDGWEWEDYLRAALAQVIRCDAVALLPRWEESPGVALELHVARALGLLVGTLDEWLGTNPPTFASTLDKTFPIEETP
jgi:hypothetical protein